MGLMGDFSPAQCTRLLPPCSFSPPSLYLLSGRRQVLVLLLRSGLPMWARGIRSCHWQEGRHRQEQTPYPISCSPGADSCETKQPLAQWMLQLSTLGYFPSPGGYRVTGTGRQLLLVTLGSGSDMLTSERSIQSEQNLS